MAKYDFDQLIPRRGTNSVKWDEEPAADILPMWVADMDFRTAPCVVEALRRRVEHGVYGYATVPESYYGAVTSWFARRHGWVPGADWILPVTGVIQALSAILRALTRPGDRVLVLTPVYNHFFIAIDNSGCSAAECELGGAAHQSWSANIFSTIGDMFPKSAIATVTGIGGMAGGVGSMILQWFAGWLFVYADETAMQFMGFEGKPAGYFVVFCICAVAYLIGWIVMKTLVPKYKPIVLD